MPVSGAPTTHGIPTFADTDLPDLAAGGLGVILAGLDALIGAYKLAEISLSAPAASIDITNIPATCHTLVLALYARCDPALGGVILSAKINNDAGANYSYQLLTVSAAVTTPAETLATTSAHLGRIPGAAAPANSFGTLLAEFANYSGASNHKSFVSRSSSRESAVSGGMVHEVAAGAYFGAGAAAPISRLTVIPGGNFVAGTLLELYGLT